MSRRVPCGALLSSRCGPAAAKSATRPALPPPCAHHGASPCKPTLQPLQTHLQPQTCVLGPRRTPQCQDTGVHTPRAPSSCQQAWTCGPAPGSAEPAPRHRRSRWPAPPASAAPSGLPARCHRSPAPAQGQMPLNVSDLNKMVNLNLIQLYQLHNIDNIKTSGQGYNHPRAGS